MATVPVWHKLRRILHHKSDFDCGQIAPWKINIKDQKQQEAWEKSRRAKTEDFAWIEQNFTDKLKK